MYKNDVIQFLCDPHLNRVQIFCILICLVYTLQHKTIDSVLERGEKLDTLVDKSTDLSAASQVRYRTESVAQLMCFSSTKYLLMHFVDKLQLLRPISTFLLKF